MSGNLQRCTDGRLVRCATTGIIRGPCAMECPIGCSGLGQNRVHAVTTGPPPGTYCADDGFYTQYDFYQWDFRPYGDNRWGCTWKWGDYLRGVLLSCIFPANEWSCVLQFAGWPGDYGDEHIPWASIRCVDGQLTGTVRLPAWSLPCVDKGYYADITFNA